ncbi:MAG TPA: glycosyltransferase family 4 protein [Chthoniobacterales bacterium]|nr:glycosyltransferase family 4 protein [Chthoniobacterales bacterium]
MIEKRSLSHQLLQIFNRYLEPGGEEAWVSTLEKSFNLPTIYFESSDWTGPNAPSLWSQALRMVYNPDAIRKLRQFQKQQRTKAWIIHNAFPTGSAAIYREAQTNRIPVIQYVHNFRPFSISGYLLPDDLNEIERWPRTFLREIARKSWRDSRIRTAWFAAVLTLSHSLGWFKNVTAWIAVSNFMRDQFIRAGVPSEKIFTLRHFWRPVADLSTTTDQDYYLFIGRLVGLKGVLVLLDVWDQIYGEQKSSGPKLVIIGEGELNDVVRARATENPLIDFRGVVAKDEKQGLLAAMRALIAPSICLESLGLVAYEAYDFAKPVLASRAGGLSEIVIHNQTGLIHDPGNRTMLFEHVMSLEREPRKRIEFGKNGRQWLLENTNIEKWRDEFNRIVEFAVSTGT